jgi:hypothetical protein
MESFFNFLDGIAQNNGSPMRAAHGAIGFGKLFEEPFHFCLVQRHIYFYGGVARG